MTRRWLATALVCAAACLGATAPRADAAGTTDYTVTSVSGLYETPPANATVVTTSHSEVAVRTTLPFAFTFFGQPFSETWITTTGYLQFGPTSDPGAQPSNYDLAFNAAHPQGGMFGVAAPLWDSLYYQSAGTMLSWTAGTAPNRRFVVAWIDYGNGSTPSSRYQFEIKLYEGSNRIEFAYKPDVTPSTWTGLSYTQGMNAWTATGSGDLRWFAPVNGNADNSGHPASDYRMDPRYVTCTGRITYDRLTPTSSGFGSTTTETPFAGGRIDLRQHAGGALLATAFADVDGYFTVQFPACNPAGTDVGDVYARTETAGGSVRDATGAASYSFLVATNVPLASSSATGTLHVDAASDPTAAWRGPANVARAIQQVYAWAGAQTTTVIPQAVVLCDATSTAATTYSPPASMVIAGLSASNPDQWDDPVVMRTYGRHVLASIAVATAQSYDDTFDKVTNDENAFAEGFGYYVWAAVTGGRQFVDATSATSATVCDLEDPQPTSRAGPDVAARVAAALYDLVDPANETIDWVDGTGAASALALQTVDGLASAPTAAQFYKKWTLQRDGLALSRILVHYGLVPDDASEPNDSAAEAASLGALGVRRDALTLQIANEDWFSVDAAGPVADLIGEADYPQMTVVPTVRLEVCDAAGTMLAYKLLTSGSGPVIVHAGAHPAGTYKLRLVHVSGDAIPTYDVQASDAFLFAQKQLRDWTQGRPYDDTVPLTGGVPPFTVSAQPPTSAVPGLGADPASLHFKGTPTQAGVYTFALSAHDAGDPQHTATSSQQVVINPPLALPIAEFYGVPAGAAFDVALPRSGGTAPFTFTVASGGPPAGVHFDAATFRLAGAAAPGSAIATFSAVDVAGSADQRDTTIVACVPLVGKSTSVDLAAGDAACGFYVDAVQGSALTFAVSTAKGSAKRALRAALVGSDGAEIAGTVLKSGTGKASATKAVAPFSGRFYFVAASAAGDVAHLLGTFTSKPPTKGKGAAENVAPLGTLDVTLGALSGATLVFTAKGDTKAGLTVSFAELVGPDGAPLPLDGLVKTKGGTVTLTAGLPTSGTWTVRLRGAGTAAGNVTYSFSMKEPKTGTYTAQ